MQHRISDASITYEDADGKSQTVKGGLVLTTQDGADFKPGTNMGPVSFQTDDLSEAQANKQADAGGVQSPPPPAR